MATFKGRDGEEIKIGGREDIKKPKPLRDLMPSVNVGNMVSKGFDNVVKGAKNISKPNTSNPGFFSKLFMGMDKGTRDPNTNEVIYSPFAKPGTASYMGPGSNFKAQGIANPIDDLKKMPSLLGAVMSKISSFGDNAAKQSSGDPSGMYGRGFVPSDIRNPNMDVGLNEGQVQSGVPSAFYVDAILRNKGAFRPDQSITNAELDSPSMMGDPFLKEYYPTQRVIPEFGPFSIRNNKFPNFYEQAGPDRGQMLPSFYEQAGPDQSMPAPLLESDRGKFNRPMKYADDFDKKLAMHYMNSMYPSGGPMGGDYSFKDVNNYSGIPKGRIFGTNANQVASNDELMKQAIDKALADDARNYNFREDNLMNRGGPTPFEGRKEIMPVQMLKSGPSKKEIAEKIVTKSLANTAEKKLLTPATEYMTDKGKGFLSSMLKKNHGGPIDPREMTPSEYLEYMKDKEAKARMGAQGMSMRDPREGYSQAGSAVGTAAGTAMGGPVGGTIGSMIGSYLPYMFNKGGNTSGPMAKIKTETFKIDYS